MVTWLNTGRYRIHQYIKLLTGSDEIPDDCSSCSKDNLLFLTHFLIIIQFVFFLVNCNIYGDIYVLPLSALSLDLALSASCTVSRCWYKQGRESTGWARHSPAVNILGCKSEGPIEEGPQSVCFDLFVH